MSTSDVTPLKRCSKCGEYKPATREYFTTATRAKMGLNSWCKKCCAQIALQRERKNGVEPRPCTFVPVGMKRCSQCGEIKPATLEYFHQQKSSKSGLLCQCKECVSKKRRKPGIVLHYAKDGHKYCKGCDTVYDLDCFYKNSKGYSALCKSCSREVTNERYKLHPELRIIYTHRRRVRILGLPYDFAESDWTRCLEYWNHRCCICGRTAENGLVIAREHWIAVNDKRPDNPGTVPTNILPMCQGKTGCNNSKGYCDPIEWLHKKFNPDEAKAILARVEAYFASLSKV